MIRESDGETIWARLHARQALVFGFLASLGFFLILALPLIAVIANPAISTGATILVYGIGLGADAVAGLVLVLAALRFSARAARGELFAIPLVTPIVDTIFRLRKP